METSEISDISGHWKSRTFRTLEIAYGREIVNLWKPQKSRTFRDIGNLGHFGTLEISDISGHWKSRTFRDIGNLGHFGKLDEFGGC